jgi:hypothetical protein
VHAVEHQRRRGRPDEGAPAGEPGQQAGGEQAERGEQQRGAAQVVPVGAGAEAGQPHDHAGDDRILDRAADQVALRPVARLQPAGQVGEEVLAHPAADPQLLDVGVAEVAVLAGGEVRRDPVRVVGRAGARRLGEVAEQDAERGGGQHRQQHQVRPPPDRPGQLLGPPPSPLALRALALAHGITSAGGSAGRRCPRPGPRPGPASRPGSARRPPRRPRPRPPGRCGRR